MTYHLLNAAMMPQAGNYKMSQLTPQQFAYHARKANGEHTLKSYIGYPSTAKILSELTGFDIPVNRDQTRLQNGDVLLIAKLKYRVQNAALKKTDAVDPTIDDFEFYFASFSE